MNSDIKHINTSVTGMTCASCATSLESYLKELDGVASVNVNYANQSADIKFHQDLVNEEMLESAARKIGYGLILGSAGEQVKETEQREGVRLALLKRKLIISIIFTVPVFIISMILNNQIPFAAEISLMFSIPVLFYAGSEFYANAYKRIRHGQLSMDTLVALSTGIAFVYSVFNTINPQYLLSRGIEPHIYFESAVVIITLILIGRFLEERAKSKTTSAIKNLIKLQPSTVSIIRNGEEIEVSVEEVIAGDLVLIKPGARIPVDGKIKRGESYLDESMITGEPVPVFKTKKDIVYTGAVNGNGALKVLATKVGSDTLLSQIISMVQNAQADKPKAQQVADKISAVFIPIVIAIAVVSALCWYFIGPSPELSHAMSVLVTVLIIACPCALGLATPTALMAGIGNGADQGILIRNADSLDSLHKTDILVLDKTGTITEGKPQLKEIVWMNGLGPKEKRELESSIFSLEKQSEHPLAKSIIDGLQNENHNIVEIEVENPQNQPGKGIVGKIEGTSFAIGNLKMMEDHNARLLDPYIKAKHIEYDLKAGTKVYVSRNGEIVCFAIIEDKVKPGIKEAIEKLRDEGVEVEMLTGDNHVTAKAVAKEVGIRHYQSDLMPTDKGKIIKELQSKNFNVAMAGDGINDAEALALADTGIAMGTGTDVAIDSAGIILMKGDLSKIIQAIKLSRNSTNTIKQNLFWAFIYNIVALPIAAGVLYPITGWLLNPMIAGAAMAFSSVSVVTNSLLLRNKR
ncbi:heavy metal translocating P-type ATPase [Marinigracilibium pacificum]|uniref:Copper-translocating P-type ATPase n=1 Tax=Marinigracilibium pacificum TaxID=2729599 RepID=A0A848J6A0_9BACT|nr:heavy metal translocating P-type ATPase [Marinigracilibium pacificum]NMM49994.1 copper-translocating P-type ATPase [Marinigracilibium pacificum]